MRRRKLMIGLGALTAGGSAAFGTEAFTSVEAQRNVDVTVAGDQSAFVAIEPLSGDNAGKYVSTEEGDDTVTLNFDSESDGPGSGVSQDAITQVNNLFQIVNQGSQPSNIYFEDSSDAVTFQVTKSTGTDTNGTRGESLEGADNSVELTVGNRVVVGMRINTLDNDVEERLLDTVTIRATAENIPGGKNLEEVSPDYIVDPDDPDARDTLADAAFLAGGDETVGIQTDELEPNATIDTPGLNIIGMGDQPTLLGGAGDDDSVLKINGPRITIQNIAIDAAEDANYGIRTEGTDTIVKDCTIENTARFDTGTSFGILAYPSGTVTIKDCILRNHQTAVFVKNQSGGTGSRVQVNAKNNYITQVDRGINTNNIFDSTNINDKEYGNIVGNRIEAAELGIRVNNHYTPNSPDHSYQVRDNRVRGAEEGINILSISGSADVDARDNVVSDCNRGYDLTNISTEEEVKIAGGSVTNCDIGIIAFSTNDAFEGAEYGDDVDGVTVENIDFSNNSEHDVRAYGSGVSIKYRGNADVSEADDATVN